MNKHIEFPQLNGTTSVGDFGQYITGLTHLLDVTIKMKAEARESGDFAQLNLLTTQITELHDFITRLSFMPLVGLSGVTLPAIAYKGNYVALNAATIEEDIAEAIEIKASCEISGNKEVVKGILRTKLRSPKQKQKAKDYGEKVAEIVKRTQMDGVDLFCLDKKQVKELKSKRITDAKSLTDEENKLLFASDMRETICELLSNGGRMEAVSFIRNYVFKPDPSLPAHVRKEKEYSDVDAHSLLNAIKERYNVKEPAKTPKTPVNNPLTIPTNSYLYIKYKRGEDVVPQSGFAIIEMGDTPASRVVVRPGIKSVVCDIEDISYYRRATRHEMSTVIKPLLRSYGMLLDGSDEDAPF